MSSLSPHGKSQCLLTSEIAFCQWIQGVTSICAGLGHENNYLVLQYIKI